MGIVNVTPDSFSDGGRLGDAQAAIRHALKLQEEGADILDVGGESTRPGAAAVPADEEMRRVLPVIEALAGRGCVVSVDTMKPEVMRAALDAGAAMVNDVMALRAPGALEAVAASDAAVCLMHMQGEPQRMQQAPCYADVVEEVKQFLQERVAACEAAGIGRERLVIDPGFGFGKTLEHNLALLKHLNRLAELGRAGAGRAVAQVDAGHADRARRGSSASLPGWRRIWLRWRAARGWCAYTMWRPCAMRWPSGMQWRNNRMGRKYFGTDGVRGRVGESPITPEFVMRSGLCRRAGAGGRSRQPAARTSIRPC